MSLRQAINAKCKECIYDPHSSGTWRNQVSECTSKNCPLYPLRPTPIDTSSKQRNAVIAADFGKKGVILSNVEIKEV